MSINDIDFADDFAVSAAASAEKLSNVAVTVRAAISDFDGVKKVTAWSKGSHRRIYIALESRNGRGRQADMYIDVNDMELHQPRWNGARTRDHYEYLVKGIEAWLSGGKFSDWI